MEYKRLLSPPPVKPATQERVSEFLRGLQKFRAKGDEPIPGAVEAWALAGILYIPGVAVARSVVPNLRNVLAFSKYVRDEDVSSGKVADIASTV